MYKVLIVDDDGIIRRGLSRTIPWEEKGFELIGAAANGEEGLELALEKKPHLLVTDIRMPFMDGFELAEKVKEELPGTKIIMLTSFGEFDLAKRALQLKVFDYLLKPIDNGLLLETALLAMKELEYEQEIKQKVIEGMPLLRQRFLEKLIQGHLTEEEIVSGAEMLELSLPKARYGVVLLKADDYSYPDYQNRFGKEMLKYCIHNVAEEIVRSHGEGIVFDSLEDETVVICYERESISTQSEHTTYRIAESIRTNVEKYLKTTVTAGIGNSYHNPREIASSYLEARSALEFRHIMGVNRVLMVGDTGLPTDTAVIEWSSLEKELTTKVKLGLQQEAFGIVETMETLVRKCSYFSLHRMRIMALEIILYLYKELQDTVEPEEAFPEHYEHIQNIQTVQEMFERIRQIVLRFVSLVNRQREQQGKSAILQAVAFIEENYRQEGLSLLDVANAVHLSPVYLSALFKKEKQINFSDFLLQVRMRAAMTLLRLQDKKTYEVAEEVGYSNPQYFSVCFKKYCGLSPSEFKTGS
ncbi:response regulator [Paenibacillus cremeus]|uniref:Response regulator n=1 Tax=Paenibacillus cremeus TaxID=2163881 RepID=A0A559KGD2_9BACL|nr:response regulator [Paenibacillus cremeus]TVY11182.1 response regulator [Paenibacillus cremeus]